MRITLVFILTLVLPSVLLSAFALQAVEAERVARLADRARSQEVEVQGVVHEVDELLQGRARAATDALRAARARTPAEAAGVAARLVATEPLFGGFVVLDAAGRRAVPTGPLAPPSWPTTGVAVALGGCAGAALCPDPLPLLLAAEERSTRDREGSLEMLASVIRRGSPEATAAALFDTGRIHEAGALLDTAPGATPLVGGMHNAREAYEALSALPLRRIDARARPVALQARFRHAMILATLKRTEQARAQLVALLDGLEAEGDLLPRDAVVELAERTGALLEDGAALARARDIAQRRERVEQAAARIEDLFGTSMRGALRDAAVARRGRAPGGVPGLLAAAGDAPAPASASGGAAAPAPVLFKARAGDRFEIVVCAPVTREGGGVAGLVALQLDLGALEAALRSRVLARGPTHSLVPVSEQPEARLDLAVAPLRPPLDHVAALYRAPPDTTPAPLGLARGTMTVWGVGLSIAGIIAGVLVTISTVRRETKAAQLKSDFVANVTHELKTPLTSIRMFLDTLLLGRVNDEAETKECLQVMARESERLTRLIEQLLVFSRIESRRWRLRLNFEHPRTMVDDALKVLADQLGVASKEELGIEVVAVQELTLVAADRFAMVEAILNILHNAWKYTPEPRRIRVVLASRRRHIEIAVEDNGIGVPRGDRRRIFVKFERGSNAEEKRIQGSGVGLSLALSILEAHRGTITYTPLEPTGSRFSLWIRK